MMNRSLRRCLRSLVLACLAVLCLRCPGGSPAADAEKTEKRFPAVYNSQDAKDQPSTPAEALARIRLPEGFRATLFAAEPDVQQPIGIATDERGRVWVAENYTYAEGKVNFATDLRDRIVILEDTDGDGRADKRKVFWDEGQKLTSVEVGFGGVWALCPPNLLFMPDRDRDDIPDGPPVVVLDGWDADAVRHNIVNGLRWGPDGWLYGRHGILATSRVGRPGASESQREQINCGVWRYHPTREVFEVVARGTTNPWGFDYDQFGEMFFINTVIGHLWHILPGAHYKRMYGSDFDPHLYELIDQTADHFHWDTREAWSDIRKGVTDTTSQAGGGHAHSGLMIYLGDNWPEKYRGTVFTINLHGRRLNNDRLARRGAGYVAQHGEDCMFFDDVWFRGIDLLSGSDGGVFVADWSDVGECHENDGVHRTSGRIYKITYGEPKKAAPFDLAAKSDAELVKIQLHKNDWYPRQARRILQERAAAKRDTSAAKKALLEMFERDPDLTHKLRAMWCLWSIGAADESWLVKQLQHPEERVRACAVRLLADVGEPPAVAMAGFTQIANGKSPGFDQLHLAAALRRMKPADRWQLALKLSRRVDLAEDPALPLLVWYAVEPLVTADVPRALELATGSMAVVRRNVARRLTEEVEKQPDAVEALVKQLETPALRAAGAQHDVLSGMADALRGWRKAPAPKSWSRVTQSLASSKSKGVQTRARELSVVFGDGRALDELREIVARGDGEPNARRQALRTLVAARSDDLVPVLFNLLADRTIANDAVRGLAAFGHPETPTRVLDAYPRLDPEGKAEVVATLASRPAWARALLEAVAAGRIPRLEISAFHARQIRGFDDHELTALLTKVWGEARGTDEEKQRLLARYRTLLPAESLQGANVSAGRALFNKTCATCHVLYGQGKSAGPDLTGSNRKNLEYLLENIVDPNAVVATDFRMSIALLASGRNVTGVVVEKTEKTLTFQTQTDRVTVERGEIEAMKPTSASLMPEGLFNTLTDDQIRDLVAYLMSTAQVPLPEETAAGK